MGMVIGMVRRTVCLASSIVARPETSADAGAITDLGHYLHPQVFVRETAVRTIACFVFSSA